MFRGENRELDSDTIDISFGSAAAGAAATTGEAGEGEAGDHQNGNHDRDHQNELICLLPLIRDGQVPGTGCPGGASAAVS
jgi:hypothetical protein